MASITAAVAAGEIRPGEAVELSRLITTSSSQTYLKFPDQPAWVSLSVG
jgi:hypothetical protein